MSEEVYLLGQVAIVTGATGGMGRVIALELARRGARVVTVARDPARANALRAQIEHHVGHDALEVIAADLSSRKGILDASHAIRERHPVVHLLVNNAGAHFRDRCVSVDGIEMHVAVDYLPAYGMITLLNDPLRRGRARVVNVVSDTLRDTRQLKLLGAARPPVVHCRELENLSRLNPADQFAPFDAYARAKLLTVMAGYSLSRDFADSGVTINAVHPGIAATGMIDDIMPSPLRPFRSLIRRTMLTPEQGADAALHLATSSTLNGVTGRYFIRDTVVSTPPITYDTAAQDRLRASSDRFFSEENRN